MRILLRVLVTAWAVITLGVGVLAFAVVSGTGGGIGVAAREAFETVPEAIMQVMGFEGAPIVLVALYWLALAAAVYVALKPRRPI
jgi:hypothetical protein